jgi:hypothetical protein
MWDYVISRILYCQKYGFPLTASESRRLSIKTSGQKRILSTSGESNLTLERV